ncbi:MAG: hypothetical protein AB7G76_11670 [Steroidobacteraceae bacterium]
MNAPAFSTFSAIAEFFVTAGVFYIVLRSRARKGFAWQLATALIIFEFSVNMMYMIFRMREVSAGEEMASTPHPLAPFMAAHGILSLLVFLLLVVYSYLAFVAQKRGAHFFADHPAITWSFLGLWTLSVGSGWALYAINYL